jgi:hypothetical protein
LGQFTLDKPRRGLGKRKLLQNRLCKYNLFTISNIPYNLIFTTKCNDSSFLITIISCDYLNLSLANEYVGDVIIQTQVIKYNQNFLQADQPIRLQYSNQIKRGLIVFGCKHKSPQTTPISEFRACFFCKPHPYLDPF